MIMTEMKIVDEEGIFKNNKPMTIEKIMGAIKQIAGWEPTAIYIGNDTLTAQKWMEINFGKYKAYAIMGDWFKIGSKKYIREARQWKTYNIWEDNRRKDLQFFFMIIFGTIVTEDEMGSFLKQYGKRCQYYLDHGMHDLITEFNIECPHGEYCMICDYKIQDLIQNNWYIRKRCRHCDICISNIDGRENKSKTYRIKLRTEHHIQYKTPNKYALPMYNDDDEEINLANPGLGFVPIPREDARCYMNAKTSKEFTVCEGCKLWFCRRMHKWCPDCKKGYEADIAKK